MKKIEISDETMLVIKSLKTLLELRICVERIWQTHENCINEECDLLLDKIADILNGELLCSINSQQIKAIENNKPVYCVL